MAVDHPVVAVAHGARAQAGWIGARHLRLRHREEGPDLTCDEGPQPPFLLLVRAEHQQNLRVAGVWCLTPEHELRPGRAADLLVQVRVVEEAGAGAACFGADVRRPQSPGLGTPAQLRNEVLVVGRETRLVRIDVLLHEGAVTCAQLVDCHRFSIAGVRLGFYMGYAPPGTSPLELIELAQEAERLGYDSAWAAEAWGTDAVTVLAWLAATTTTLKVGSAIMQIPGRSPANTAMTAATLDLLSGGRFLLGLGTSGPQVVEGWHGQAWGKPLRKTREYVEIVRTVLRRDVLEHHGEHYDIPYTGSDSTGLGKPLKLMARPLRSEIPIYLASISPRSVELAFEIADGWMPIFFVPERARDVFPMSSARVGFDIAPSVPVVLTDDVESGRDALKQYYALYIGGMGARGKNFYNDLFARYGYEGEARQIQDLFLDGKQRDAAAVVPDRFVDEAALVGPKERIAERLDAFREAGATSLLVSTRDVAAVRAVAEVAL